MLSRTFTPEPSIAMGMQAVNWLRIIHYEEYKNIIDYSDELFLTPLARYKNVVDFEKIIIVIRGST